MGGQGFMPVAGYRGHRAAGSGQRARAAATGERATADIGKPRAPAGGGAGAYLALRFRWRR
jgi:hypothetical protein